MQASLRRAISTAYYAVFHSLARIAADLIVGTDRNEAWHQAHRALEHGSAKNACLNARGNAKISTGNPRVRVCVRYFADCTATG